MVDFFKLSVPLLKHNHTHVSTPLGSAPSAQWNSGDKNMPMPMLPGVPVVRRSFVSDPEVSELLINV